MFHDFQIKETSFKNVWMQEKIKNHPLNTNSYSLLLLESEYKSMYFLYTNIL